MWVNHEFDVLTALYRAGADIPKPIARTQTAILMQYFGDRERAAPSLQSSELSSTTVVSMGRWEEKEKWKKRSNGSGSALIILVP